MRGIHRWLVNSPPKGPVTRKMFPFDDVIIPWGYSNQIQRSDTGGYGYIYQIQSSAVITRTNIEIYHTNNYRNWGRISMKFWIHRGLPYLALPGELRVYFVTICEKIDRVITAQYCITTTQHTLCDFYAIYCYYSKPQLHICRCLCVPTWRTHEDCLVTVWIIRNHGIYLRRGSVKKLENMKPPGNFTLTSLQPTITFKRRARRSNTSVHRKAKGNTVKVSPMAPPN